MQSEDLKRDVFLKVPKDIYEEGILWKLKKPLYGLCDAGRRFWLSLKKCVEAHGYEKLAGDNAFYYKRENGELSGMLLLHVDDMIIGGSEKFVMETTEMIKERLTVSKICDGAFRFCGLDIELLKSGKIRWRNMQRALSRLNWTRSGRRRRRQATRK